VRLLARVIDEHLVAGGRHLSFVAEVDTAVPVGPEGAEPTPSWLVVACGCISSTSPPIWRSWVGRPRCPC
jgi:hypothetical protein